MSQSDDYNLVLAESVDSVDALNAKFYGRFPYPWSPAKFESLADPYFQTTMVNQDIGDWNHRTLPKRPNIFVAGCGTNQALFTALKFPQASVRGADMSATSLATCTANAKSLNVSNLQLKRESLNHIPYKEEFDYVICTGVIHHNAEPQRTLEKIAGALKPSGIMELMVYNRFHWIMPFAFQQAIRIFSEDEETTDFEGELPIVEKLYDELPKGTMMSDYLNQLRGTDESLLADAVLQPVAYSYTVESLEEMADRCGLEILTPCINQFDKSEGKLPWNLEFSDPELRAKYESLPDTRRWHLSNLLLMESSSQLWFYLQRKDSGRRRKTEHEICEEFLDTTFVRNGTTQSNYLKNMIDGTYKLAPTSIPYPMAEPHPSVRNIYEAADGKTPMREIFRRLEIDTAFHVANPARLNLTTTAYPYLKAAPQTEQKTDDGVAGDPNARRRLEKSNYEKLKSIRDRKNQN
jgi:SAM-dependent methyltransferase